MSCTQIMDDVSLKVNFTSKVCTWGSVSILSTGHARSYQHHNGRLWLFTNCWDVLFVYDVSQTCCTLLAVVSFLNKTPQTPPYISKCNSIDHHKVVLTPYSTLFRKALKISYLNGPSSGIIFHKKKGGYDDKKPFQQAEIRV